MSGEGASGRRRAGAAGEQDGRCQARNRRREQCGRWASPGMRVCHSHGGAIGSGAPVGNQNAYKHGLRAETGNAGRRERIQEFMGREGLKVEIAMMRAKIDEAYDEDVGLTVFARGNEGLARLVKVERELSELGKDATEEALGLAVEAAARRIGLVGFYDDEAG